MKNITFIESVLALSMAAAAGFAVSCSTVDPIVDTPVAPKTPEPSPQVEKDHVCHISSTLEQPVQTKMKLSGDDDGGYDLVWSADDAIYLVCLNKAGDYIRPKFTLTSGAGSGNGSFTGEIDEGYIPTYAAFPWSTALKYTNGTLTFNVPQEKSVAENNIALKVNPCVATVERQMDGSYTMPFKNVMSLFRVTLTSGTYTRISKIALHDHAGNQLWGTCTVPIDPDYGSLDYEHVTFTGGDNTLYLKWNSYSAISKTPKSFYFSVPPGTLDRGYSIVVYEYDDTKENNVGKAYTFLQKASESKGTVRSVILAVNANGIKEKSEPYDPKARGYYKSLFVDAGTSLNNIYLPEHIPAIEKLGLEDDYEYLSSKTYYNLQTDILVENDGKVSVTNIKYRDDNGVLLYPDGSPRFRAVFVNGGSSQPHGAKLDVQGRRNFHDFFINGGSYIGACAGAVLASTTVDSVNHYDDADAENNYTFGMWPGNVTHTGWPSNFGQTDSPSVYTAMTVTSAFAAESGGSLTSGQSVDDVRHHGGVLIRDNHLSACPGAVRLADYAYTYPHSDSNIDDSLRFNETTVDSDLFGGDDWNGFCSTFAYKHTDSDGVDTGRAILCGSHFENAKEGSQLDFFKSMLQYALDGNGAPRLKGRLQLGNTIKIDKTYSDGDPAPAMIGDRQYHHFMFTTEKELEEFQLTLASEFGADLGIDLYLAMHKGGIAWLSDSEYVLCNKGGNKEFKIKSLPAGTWYVSVFCATSVDAEPLDYNGTSFYFGYSGHTELMEGVAYSLSATVGSTVGSGTGGGTGEEEEM